MIYGNKALAKSEEMNLESIEIFFNESINFITIMEQQEYVTERIGDIINIYDIIDNIRNGIAKIIAWIGDLIRKVWPAFAKWFYKIANFLQTSGNARIDKVGAEFVVFRTNPYKTTGKFLDGAIELCTNISDYIRPNEIQRGEYIHFENGYNKLKVDYFMDEYNDILYSSIAEIKAMPENNERVKIHNSEQLKSIHASVMNLWDAASNRYNDLKDILDSKTLPNMLKLLETKAGYSEGRVDLIYHLRSIYKILTTAFAIEKEETRSLFQTIVSITKHLSLAGINSDGARDYPVFTFEPFSIDADDEKLIF